MPTTDAASFAKYRLDRLDRPHAIVAVRPGDEDLICQSCGFLVHPIAGGYRHDADEIARERRALASWPGR